MCSNIVIIFVFSHHEQEYPVVSDFVGKRCCATPQGKVFRENTGAEGEDDFRENPQGLTLPVDQGA